MVITYTLEEDHCEDGIVVIPRESLNEVLEKITLVSDVEAAMQEAIESGASGAELSAIIARKKLK